MKRLLATLCIFLAALLLTACTKPVPQQPPSGLLPEVPVTVPEEEAPAPGLSVFDGVYRSQVPMEGDAQYVQITARNGFLLLEHYLCMDGSVYSFWAEEFWPDEAGITTEDLTSVSGMSQTFSMMTMGELYDSMPRHRVISLTEEGVVLNYDDADAEYYVTDTGFSYHTPAQQLWEILGEATGKPDETLFGTWSFRNGREAACVTFREDGTVSCLRKSIGEPARIYEGVYAFEKGGSVNIAAEKAGAGSYPLSMTWQWVVDRDKMLWLTFEDGQRIIFYPREGEVTETVPPQLALGYAGSSGDLSGTYTDKYGTEYTYLYRIPQFYGYDDAVMAVNQEIMDLFGSIVEAELEAISQNEFISYTDVNWESNVHEGVLFLHVYANTWNREEHRAYYYDTEAGTFLTTQEVLDRLLIDKNYFLEAVREYAAAAFEETFSGLPEDDRAEMGYYEMQEWTVSDEAVNLDIPIYVNMFGSIAVHARLGSMAGSGILWTVLYPFDGAVG